MANKSIIELLDDMHLSSQQLFLDYYYAMQSNNISNANNILVRNPSLSNQLINSQNVNLLLKGINERELEPKENIDEHLAELLIQFQNMVNNIKIMGQFSENLQYYPNNFVYYQGKSYYVYSQPPIGTLPTNPQYWIEYDIKGLKGYGGINLNLRYNWDNTVDYKIGDVVVYKNRLWYALADNTDFTPNLNHYPWVIISMPQMPNRTPIQKATPQSGYSVGDFWFQIIQGDDIMTSKWSIRQSETTPRFSSGVFSINNNIYIVGGILKNFALSNANETYDILTGTWSQKASMPANRSRFGYFTIGEKGYVVGGILDNGEITNSVISYDPTTNSWTTKSNLPIKMITDAVSDGTYGYVFGGVDENENIVPNGYIYNSTSDTWETTTNKPIPTRGHALINVGNDIYLIGGIDALEETVSNVEVYNITTKTFSNKARITTPRSYLGLFEKAGKIYAVGGLDKNWYSLNVNEKFDIEKNEWETDIPMNYARSSLNIAQVGSKAYAIGGIDIGISAVNGYNEEYGISDIPSNFDMTIDTDFGADLKFGIKTKENSTNDFYIEWGDGTESELIVSANQEINHTYSQSGEYIVKIVGTTTGFELSSGKEKLKSVDKCDLSFSNIDNMFLNCINLEAIVDGIFDNSTTISTAISTFKGCAKLSVLPVGLFDQNINITSFKETFSDTDITTIPNGLFNRNNLVTSFESCFEDCISLANIPLGLFDENVSVTNFANCFSGCASLVSIPANLFINNSYCTNFSNIFAECLSLVTIPIGIFSNSIAVTNFSNAFFGCSKLSSLPVGLFREAVNCINYTNVFNNTLITTLPNYTFNGNNATFTLPDDLTDMGNYSMNGLNISSGYFAGNTTIKTIGDYIFSNTVENWNVMFKNATNLISVGVQDFRNVTSLTEIFEGCINLTTLGGFYYIENENKIPTLKLDLDLSDCSNLTHESLTNVCNSLVTLTPTTTKNLTLGETNLNKLDDVEKFVVVNKNWNLVGWVKPAVTQTLAEQMVQQTYGFEGSSTSSKYETGLYYEVDLINSSGVTVSQYYVDKTTGLIYEIGEEPIKEYQIDYTIDRDEYPTKWLSKTATNDTNGKLLADWIKSIISEADNRIYVDVKSTSNLTDLTNTFSGISENLYSLKLEDTSNVVSFENTFSGCSRLNIVQVDTKNATTLKNMFSGCSELVNISPKTFDTSKVKNMSGMFYGCNSLSSYPSFTDTSKVTDMSKMFNYNSSMVTSPALDMTSVTNASEMFSGNSSLENINIINVNNVQDASSMFYNCRSLVSLPSLSFNNCIDASRAFENTGLTTIPTSLKFPKAKDMSFIFANCASLTTVIGGFFPNTCEDASNAFIQCSNLVNMPSDITTVFGTNTNLTNVSGLFAGCSSLKKVGEHFVYTWSYDSEADKYAPDLNNSLLEQQLFKNCTNITDMSYIFNGCTLLGSEKKAHPSGDEFEIGLPAGFFYWCPNVVNISHAFDGCKHIYNVGQKEANKCLFVNNTELKDISYAFANSETGYIIDADDIEGGRVFRNCNKIENASYLFEDASASWYSEYTVPVFIYDSKVLKNIEGMYSGFQSPIYLGSTNPNDNMTWSKMDTYMPILENCSKLFYDCSQLGGASDRTEEDANVLTVIASFNKITTLTNHAQAFYNCTGLPNYSSIPTGWK